MVAVLMLEVGISWLLLALCLQLVEQLYFGGSCIGHVCLFAGSTVNTL